MAGGGSAGPRRRLAALEGAESDDVPEFVKRVGDELRVEAQDISVVKWHAEPLHPHRCETARTPPPARWLGYNHHRVHSAIGGPPVSRVTTLQRDTPSAST
jgi:hypothetical protein